MRPLFRVQDMNQRRGSLGEPEMPEGAQEPTERGTVAVTKDKPGKKAQMAMGARWGRSSRILRSRNLRPGTW